MQGNLLRESSCQYADFDLRLKLGPMGSQGPPARLLQSSTDSSLPALATRLASVPWRLVHDWLDVGVRKPIFLDAQEVLRFMRAC